VDHHDHERNQPEMPTITPRNWDTSITDALRPLPQDLREKLHIREDVLVEARCPKCDGAVFRLVDHEPVCGGCSVGFGTVVSSTGARPRLAISTESTILTAILVDTPEGPRNLLVLGDESTTFKLRSRRQENSIERLQFLVRSLVYPAVGLMRDGEGVWGHPGGERLEGGKMVPTFLEVMDELCRLGEESSEAAR
jgi:hypothetical protein